MLLFASNDTTIMLNGVTVVDAAKRDYQMRSSQNSVRINQAYLAENIAGSLMQSLEGIPGIKAMSIGSGQSKPTIRGLGFNRMVVTEDGIKHEGQQWGDDHGLEMDQFAIDHAEIIKGPAALLHGSDAIGGVLNLYTNHVPVMPFEGTVQLFGRTNNGQMGLSAKVGGRYEHFFYRANLTLIDYADFKVPTVLFLFYPSERPPLAKHSGEGTRWECDAGIYEQPFPHRHPLVQLVLQKRILCQRSWVRGPAVRY